MQQPGLETTFYAVVLILQVQMGNLRLDLGRVRYDAEPPSRFPPEAQIGLGVGAAVLAFVVLLLILMYR